MELPVEALHEARCPYASSQWPLQTSQQPISSNELLGSSQPTLRLQLYRRCNADSWWGTCDHIYNEGPTALAHK